MIKSLQSVSLKKYKKPLLIVLISIISLFFIGGTIAYFKREALLKKAIAKAISLAKSKYNLNVKIANYGFSGLSTVHFQDISIIPEQSDSLAKIDDLTVGVKLFPLIFGKVKISELSVNKALISFVKKDSLSNYDFLFKKNTKDTVSNSQKTDLSELANKLLNQALDKIPDDMKVSNFMITFDEDTTHFSLLTETATIDHGEVKSTIKLNKNQAVWHLNGTADPSNQQLDLKLFADNQKVEFPYLDKKYSLKLSFDTVRSVMTRAEKLGDKFEIEGSWSVKNLLINQPRIAVNDIIVKDGAIDAKILIGSNYVALDSSSVVYLGKSEMSPFLKYIVSPNKIYELKIKAFEQNAQNIFDAFPTGLFESLEGIKVKGKLKYDLNFYLDSSKPDKVVFNSSLTGDHDFKILKFGKTDFQKINGVFTYTPYEKGKPVRNIIIGPSNPNYTPLNQISPNIQHALLTSEDPSFYSHHGFVEESLRQSIATNFKAKSFKRGGSTISMQLVKNVFLSRQKNLARKIEEILIVWLIENQHLSNKARMYEVYLNIIEWGRNVYGIGEASSYYFGKRPADLSVGESIYLAHIVPKPKSSLYSWQPDGSLKPYLTGYYNLIGGLMARRGYINNDSTNYGFYGVKLKESLRAQIAPSDFVPDSLADDDENGFFNLNIFNKSNKADSITKKETFLKKILGSTEESKKDTVSGSKTPKQLRQERREQRKKGN
ncbi:MAG: transglycosylase domain-containing protein [Bacteroidetes bacterium]|nr:transglycosylase domain-containing protein [Bacteroidota bacterium]MBU1484763.1 transglycosylase domain-containing protein [Bacteroidota bacterium]MBU2376890.1 transglycosylase domain-containing protein [Bacteroidota bacterium]